MFAKRPKRGEEDDDLLKFQEEFLQESAGKTSATVINARRSALSSSVIGDLAEEALKMSTGDETSPESKETKERKIEGKMPIYDT